MGATVDSAPAHHFAPHRMPNGPRSTQHTTKAVLDQGRLKEQVQAATATPPPPPLWKDMWGVYGGVCVYLPLHTINWSM